jgi:8-oxo-dGTP diphosphatase
MNRRATEECKAIDQQIFIVKAGIIQGKRLLVLTSSEPGHGSKRDLPGGKLIYGEDPFSALCREVLEETGLSIVPVAPVRIWAFVESDGKQFIGSTIACTADSDAVHLSGEHSRYSWIAREAIPKDWVERDELLAVFDLVEHGAPRISGTSMRAWPKTDAGTRI